MPELWVGKGTKGGAGAPRTLNERATGARSIPSNWGITTQVYRKSVTCSKRYEGKMPPPRQHISERRCTDLSISYLRSLNEVSSFASRINPSAAEAFNQLGNLAMARQDYAEAVRQFKKACQLEPRMTAYQLNLKTAEGSAEK